MTHVEPDHVTPSTLIGQRVSRRTVVRTAAWSVPAVSVVTAAPAFAVSACVPGSLTWDFDDLGTALPAGVAVRTAATATSRGNVATFNTTKALWGSTSGGFKNAASATTGAGSDTATQDGATDRALAVRQTGTAGANLDPGACFEFAVGSTVGKTGLQAAFNLQSLDTAAGVTRTTTWTVDAWVDGVAVAPTSSTGSLVTNNTFSNTSISAVFPSTVDEASDVYIRVYAASATSGSGSRPMTAIDNMAISWTCPQPPRA